MSILIGIVIYVLLVLFIGKFCSLTGGGED